MRSDLPKGFLEYAVKLKTDGDRLDDLKSRTPENGARQNEIRKPRGTIGKENRLRGEVKNGNLL